MFGPSGGFSPFVKGQLDSRKRQHDEALLAKAAQQTKVTTDRALNELITALSERQGAEREALAQDIASALGPQIRAAVGPEFRAMERRDQASSRQSVIVNVVISGISLVVGYLLGYLPQLWRLIFH